MITGHGGVIVTRNKDKSIPTAYLELLLKQYDRAIGCAFAENGKIEKFSENATPSIESVGQAEKAFNADLYLFFGSYAGNFHEDDLQPFTLVVDDFDNDVLVGFLEGEFPAFSQPESTYSNAFRVVTDTLAEKFQKVYDDCEGDPDKMTTILESPSFHKDFRTILHPRGVITVLASNGWAHTYSINSEMGIFPWGTTSNRLGYAEGETKQEVKTAEPAKTLSAAERLALKRAAAKTEAPAAKPSVPEVKPPVPDHKTDTAPKKDDIVLPDSDPIMLPPPNYTNAKAIGKWFNRNFGFKPVGFESGKVGLPYSKLKPNSALRVHKPGDPYPQQHGITSEIPPIIGPRDLEALTKKFLPEMMEDSKNLVTLEDVKQNEENFTSFFEQCGDYPVHLFLRWSLRKKRELVKEYPQAAYTVIVDLCNMLIKANPKLLQAPAEEKPEKKEEGIVAKALTAAERLAAKRAARM